MSQNRDNSAAFIEATQYSDFILENLNDNLLPEGFVRDVSDFASGTTLNIKSVGSVTLQDVAENDPLVSTPIDSDTVTLTIGNYPGDRWHITDELRHDGTQVEQLSAMRAMESTRALAEYFETLFLSTAGSAQTSANVNLVNGRPHRWVAGGASGTSRNMTMADFVALKLSADKAKNPQAGRVMIVDPIVEATLNSLTNLTNVSNNPMFGGIVTEGFARDHKFLHNIYGWDIYTSNYLPVKTATEALDASSYDLANDTAEIGDVANIAMCIADDNTKPIMKAWRQMPSVEGWRNPDLRRDEFQTTARLGMGAQRLDTLFVIYTDEATY